MTREEKISRLKDILSEINENDNAVCYLTSEDNELIESVIEALEQQSCEDAISREDALMCMTGEYIADMTYKPEDIISKHIRRLRALPPVQPKIKTGHISIDDVMSVFDDFMCGEVDEDGTNTFLEMLKDKAESEET